MQQIKKDFPLLQHTIDGHPIRYCDNASSTQKPQAVLNAMDHLYTSHYANTYRGVYPYGELTTQQYEKARSTVARFINAYSAAEIIFTRGATESINFIATVVARTYLKPGDEIVITQLEHHSNFLPWQQLVHSHGIILRVIPVEKDGTLNMDQARNMISAKTKLVATTHVSNAIGTHVDIYTLRDYARAVGAYFLVDAAQSVPHMLVDIQKIDSDFLVFSGHKVCGPTGIGVLYIKHTLHDVIEPYQYGGGMVFSVGELQSKWLAAPHKFEAGTPPIAEAVGLAAAIQYLEDHISAHDLHVHTAALCAYLIDQLSHMPNIHIIGNIQELITRGHLVSFVHRTIHAHDIAAYLGKHGICVRAGHHCAQPVAAALGYDATVRVSFYIYNSFDDVDALISLLRTL